MNRHLCGEIVAFLGVSDSAREYPHGLGDSVARLGIIPSTG